MKFADNIEQYLIDSGWFFGRKISIQGLKKCLTKEKLIVSPSAEKFLGEFGNLIITFKINDSEFDTIHFDVCKAVNDIDSRWIKEDYSKRLFTNQLCIIGQAYTNHLTLLMTYDGKVYGGYDDLLYYIAENGENAIAHLCAKSSFTEIP